jgi:hypothetical protein
VDDIRRYQLVHDGNYPGTTLPVFKVYDALDYNDITIKYPRPVGEVWGVGVKGVTGQWVPTGVRYQLSGSMAESMDESAVLPAGHYGDAARAMVAPLNRWADTQTNAGLAGTVPSEFAGQ